MCEHTFKIRISFVQTFDISDRRQLDQHKSIPIFLWMYSLLILVDDGGSIARFRPFLFCEIYIIAYISACPQDGTRITVISGNTDTPRVF